MRKADVAEYILSLTTTPERAASIVGDLMQESAQRGTVGFWISLLRLTASMVWRVWVDNPLRMAGLAFGACLLNGLLFVISIAAIVAAGDLAVVVIKRLGLDVDAELFLASWGTRCTAAASQILIGRWLARRAPGKELAACTAFLSLDTVLWTSFAVGVHWIRPLTLDRADMVMGPILNVVVGLFLFHGVEQIREQAAASQPTSSR